MLLLILMILMLKSNNMVDADVEVIDIDCVNVVVCSRVS
jgi:hypothetical protein